MAVLNLTNAVAKAMANAITTALDAGTAGIIEVYTGTIPANADTAITTQTLLVTLTFSATSFTAATDANPGALLTANAISSGVAVAPGTATWARLLTQAGGTVIADIDVGTSGATMDFDSVTWTLGQTIACSAFTITVAE